MDAAKSTRSCTKTADAVCQGQLATSFPILWFARAQCGGQLRTSTTSVSRFTCGELCALTVPSDTCGAAILLAFHASNIIPTRAKHVRATLLTEPVVPVDSRTANRVSPKSSPPCRSVSDVSVMVEMNLSLNGVAVPKPRSATRTVFETIRGGAGGGIR